MACIKIDLRTDTHKCQVPLENSISGVHKSGSGLQMSLFEPYIRKQIQGAYLFVELHFVIFYAPFAKVYCVPIKISVSMFIEYTLWSLAMKLA